MSEKKHVYVAINEVMQKIAKVGIAKENRNTQQNYKFRGIDDVYNALAPFLAEAKLLILPRVIAREVTERQTKSGGALFYVVLDVEFDLVSAVDASLHTIRVAGEAMDSADKATNKAMSAAYKYACMEAFCIPTEGDNDADSTTHEVKPADVPEGYDKWKHDIQAVADEGTARLQDVWKSTNGDFRKHATKHDLQWWESTKQRAERVRNAA